MNDLEVAAWHRERAEKLTEEGKAKLYEAKLHREMADKIKAGSSRAVVTLVNGSQLTNAHALGGLTIEKIRSYLSHKGGRIKHLAKHFDVEPKEIESLITAEDSGVIIKQRGWLSLAGDISTQSL